jgi:hypoxanthine phosphoribosyltransferase
MAPQDALRVLISEAEIGRRVEELAARVSADYAEVEDLLMVGVLRGAFIFLADLARLLTIPRRIDFIAVSSYEDSDQRDGAVRLIMDVRRQVRDTHVLIVEDIVDTGHTLDYLKQTLAARRPASIKTCALVRKPSRHEVDVEIDYLGFEIPDVWVVGYGLDWADRYRALPYIGVVEP